jgi:glycosyltransferase involved in cell wall biosynthesis
LSYALVTPARNEDAFIEQTIESVLAQTILPVRWIIVSDGSTDRTDEIVERYATAHDWIELLRRPERPDRQFAAKAHAFNFGYARLKSLEFDIIGNLDADITFERDYIEFLLGRFRSDPHLGVVGTPFVDDHLRPGVHSYAHRHAQLEHVSGACQLFRRSCLEDVGGYVPVLGGAVDWIAVTTARMRGWKTRTFTEKICFHHRKLGTGNNNELMVRFHYGEKAYSVGGHPLWIAIRSFSEMRHPPLVLGGILFVLGYITAWARRVPRVVTPELADFHRGEQMHRLRRLLRLSAKASGDKQLHAAA